MYTCTICNAKKTQLSCNPEFEFRRRCPLKDESSIEGVSDWCDQCGVLRFFFRESELDPAQRLDEEPRKLASTILDAAVRKHRVADVAQRAKQHQRFREVQQTLRRDIPSQMSPPAPQSSPWHRQIRSVSEDRHHRRKNILQEGQPRSRSMVNEMRNRQPALYRLAEEKNIPLTGQIQEFPEQSNRLDDDDALLINQGAFAKHQQRKDPKNQWHEEMQRNVQQMLSASPSRGKKYRGILTPEGHYNRMRPEDGVQKRQITGNLMVSPPKERITKEEIDRELKELRDMERMEGLNIKLNEKLLQLNEWERISRRVEAESSRVRAELNDLQLQKELQVGSILNEDPPNRGRQCGGAQIASLVPSSANINQQNADKVIGDALDKKMECMIETLKEEAGQQGLMDEKKQRPQEKKEGQGLMDEKKKRPQEKKEDETQGFKPTAPPANDLAVEEPTANVVEDSRYMDSLPENSIKVSPLYFLHGKRVRSKLNILVSTVQRAQYRGYPEDPQQLMQNLHSSQLMKRREPPMAQFGTLPCPQSELAALVHLKRDVIEGQLRPLKVCRSPVYCPDGDCRRMFFISDFNEHLTHGHPSLAMERTSPYQVKTFFLDTRVTHHNKAKCHMVYFLRDKFIDHQSEKFPSLLPVLVMSARVDIVDIFIPNTDAQSSPRPLSNDLENEIYVFWLTTVRPDDHKLMGTISVWPTNGKPMAEHIIVQTSEIYNIRSSQKLKSICKSTRVLMLSGSQVNRMTEGGKHLLAVQVQIY